jgi:hypothetical protein
MVSNRKVLYPHSFLNVVYNTLLGKARKQRGVGTEWGASDTGLY